MKILSGSLGGRQLKTATVGAGYRPAMAKVRAALFSMLTSRGVVWSSVRVLDLFAGSGSLAFEALSRGALEVWMVESDPKAIKILQANADAFQLGADRCHIIQEDVARVVMRRPATPCDIIFIDPPYAADRVQATLRSLMRAGWLTEDGIIAAEVEASLKFDPEQAHADLECIADRTYGQTRILLWTPKNEK